MFNQIVLYPFIFQGEISFRTDGRFWSAYAEPSA